MSIAVQMINYSFKYDESDGYVLKNCNFTLEYGKFCVLSGLSGEGKTTLLSSINGIIPYNLQGVQEGEIYIDGKNADGSKMYARAKEVGSVLQNADSQIFHSRVCDELAFGCENLNFSPKVIKEKITEICELLNLSPDDGTKTLSGGQKQRLITGSTLAMGQRILLLDEPLANLDTAACRHLMMLLRDLCAHGYAVLLVEHRLDMVLPYADKLYSLEDGGIIEIKKDELLYSNMQKISDICMPGTSREELISIKNLHYTVKQRSILGGLNMSLYRGERIVILGENGCGKTTLLRLIAGLIKPSGGDIEHNIGAKTSSKNWYKKVGYVYQEPSYQLFMPSVIDEVGYASSVEWRERCMREFSLNNLSGRHPQSLSEGQKRRVSIASVVAGCPELLLLDEPTVGQDFNNLENMVTALNKIHIETQNTMVTITHDYRCADALADRVIWLEGGCVYKEGGKSLIEEYFKANLYHEN